MAFVSRPFVHGSTHPLVHFPNDPLSPRPTPRPPSARTATPSRPAGSCSAPARSRSKTARSSATTSRPRRARCSRNVRAVLEAAGVGLGDVVKTTVYLDTMDDFAAMNAVYADAFGDHRPARVDGRRPRPAGRGARRDRGHGGAVTDVRPFFEAYGRAFEAYDADAIAATYATPCLFVRDGVTVAAGTTDDVLESVRSLLDLHRAWDVQTAPPGPDRRLGAGAGPRARPRRLDARPARHPRRVDLRHDVHPRPRRGRLADRRRRHARRAVLRAGRDAQAASRFEPRPPWQGE